MSFTVWQNDYGKDGEKPSWISTKTSFHPGFWRQSLQFVSFCGKASGSIHIGAIWLCNVCPAGYTRTLIFYVLTIQFFTPAEQLPFMFISLVFICVGFSVIGSSVAGFTVTGFSDDGLANSGSFLKRSEFVFVVLLTPFSAWDMKHRRRI